MRISGPTLNEKDALAMNVRDDADLGARDEPRARERPLPLFGGLSLLLPALGWWTAWRYWGGPGSDWAKGTLSGVGIIWIAYLVALPAGLVGFICSVIGMERNERFFLLTLLGLIVNVIPLVAVLIITFTIM